MDKWTRKFLGHKMQVVPSWNLSLTGLDTPDAKVRRIPFHSFIFVTTVTTIMTIAVLSVNY